MTPSGLFFLFRSVVGEDHYDEVGVYKYILANANFWRLWVKITTSKQKVLHLNFLRGKFFTLQDPFCPHDK